MVWFVQFLFPFVYVFNFVPFLFTVFFGGLSRLFCRRFQHGDQTVLAVLVGIVAQRGRGGASAAPT